MIIIKNMIHILIYQIELLIMLTIERVADPEPSLAATTSSPPN